MTGFMVPGRLRSGTFRFAGPLNWVSYAGLNERS